MNGFLRPVIWDSGPAARDPNTEPTKKNPIVRPARVSDMPRDSMA